jgi:hypothetical protein
VIAFAQGLGIPEVVIGSVALRQERNKPAKLETSLRVLKVGTGQAAGEISREVGMEELSNREGAGELASRIAPQLNNLLVGAAEGERKTEITGTPAEQSGRAASAPASDTAGRWTVTLPSAQYAYWKELERALREQFKTLHVASLEMGTSEGTIRLDGVDGSAISKMNGTSLPSGAQIRIESYSTETRSIKLSFTPPGTAKPEPKK